MAQAQNETTIQESLNNVTIQGVLKEVDITHKAKNGVDAIYGSFIVVTDSENEHKIKFYASELTKKGKEHPAYKSLIHLEEYDTVADLLEHNPEMDKQTAYNSASKINAKCQLSMNDYYSKEQGLLKSYPEIKGSFVNKAKPEADGTILYYAQFDVLGVLESVKPEVEKEEETGRGVARIILFDYKGSAMPIDFVLGQDAYNYVDTNYDNVREVGETEVCPTYEFMGDLVNRETVEVKEIPTDFGKPKTVRNTTSLHERVITGGMELNDVPNYSPYKMEVVKKAMAQREIFLKEKEEEGKKPKTQGAKTFNKPNNTKAQSTGQNLSW